MEKTKHYILIYPTGDPDERPVRLLFNDKEQKDSYVKSEFNFCRKENDKYLSSVGEAREEARTAFLLKRVTFAKQMKFEQKSLGDRYMWVRKETELSLA